MQPSYETLSQLQRRRVVFQASLSCPLGRSTSYASDISSKASITSQEPSRLQQARASDWTIVMVCAYCLFYQLFACTLFSPVIPSRLKFIGVDKVEETTGYLSSVWAAGCVIASPIAGWLPSVYKNKRIQLLAYIVILMAASLIFAFVPTVAGLMAGRLLHGLGASGLWTVAMGLLNDNIAPGRLGFMTGICQVGYAIGNSVSPTMGGSIYESMGWSSLCYFAIGMGGLNLLLCLVYLPTDCFVSSMGLEVRQQLDQTVKLSTSSPCQGASVRTILKMIFCNSKYLVGVAIGLVWGAFTNGILYTALPIRLEDRYNLSSKEIGYSSLAIAGPNIIFAPLAGWMTDRLGARPLMLSCLASFALWNALMCIDALPYAAFLTVLAGVGISASFIATPLLVHWASVDRAFGSPVGATLICATFSTAVSVASLVFPLLSGAVLGGIGISLGWKILLALLTGGLFLSLVFAYFCMRLPEPSEQVEVGSGKDTMSKEILV